MSFFAWMFFALFIMKITHQTDLSWWLVFGPLWVYWGFIGITMAVSRFMEDIDG